MNEVILESSDKMEKSVDAFKKELPKSVPEGPLCPFLMVLWLMPMAVPCLSIKLVLSPFRRAE